MDTTHFTYCSRICESCGGDSLELLYSFSHTAYTTSKRWRFDVNDVICTKCGFVFVSPSPTSGALLDYYADTFAKFKEQALDFKVANRIKFIREVSPGNAKTFLELGAHNKTLFHSELDHLFEEITTIEPNIDADGDFKRINSLLNGNFDVVAHYFVLEHVPDIKSFVQQCYYLLRSGGVMICEVPDLMLYPKDISALILHEHVNHFTPQTLTQICEKVGFKRIRYSHSDCSRSFGFVIAFEKNGTPIPNEMPSQYDENKRAFNLGLDQLNSFLKLKEKILSLIHDLERRNEKILIWGANDNLLKIFPFENEIPPNVVIVDSNPRKKTFLSNGMVKSPDEVKGILNDFTSIIITTNLHSESILNSLRTDYRKTFEKEKIYLFDYYKPV